jgi:ankyrin repeat protein
MQKPPPHISMLLIVLLVGVLTWLAGAAVQHDRANRALIAASKGSNTRAAIAALDAGADPNARDDGGLLPATWRHLCQWFGRLRGKNTQPDDDPEPTALIVAFEGHPIPNTSIVMSAPENVALVKVLLDRGADTNARDINGETALLLAIRERCTDTVKLFLDKGADANVVAEGASPGTPLTMAVGVGKPWLVKLLLAKGANVNLSDRTGCTPLIYAGQGRRAAIVRLLLEKGADVNAKGANGWTALMSAVEMGETDTVRVLLGRGADVNIKNKGGATALKLLGAGASGAANGTATFSGWAPRKQYVEIVRLLKKAGAR